MKKLVVQLQVKDFVDSNPNKNYLMDYVEDMYAISKAYAQKYSKRVGADYHSIESKDAWPPASGKHVAFQKFKLYDLAEEYDQILYLDSDYIIKDEAPDIFKQCGAVSAVCLEPDEPGRFALSSRINVPPSRYFNSGFMYLNKKDLMSTKDLLLQHMQSYDYASEDCFDQGLFNKVFFDSGISLLYLDSGLWNASNLVWGKYGDHYSGFSKTKWDIGKYL
jgi:lipopolysaccharide biosynthesis glycosyltransferase